MLLNKCSCCCFLWLVLGCASAQPRADLTVGRIDALETEVNAMKVEFTAVKGDVTFIQKKQQTQITTGDQSAVFIVRGGLGVSVIVAFVFFIWWIKARYALRSCVEAIEPSGTLSAIKVAAECNSHQYLVWKYLHKMVQKWTRSRD